MKKFLLFLLLLLCSSIFVFSQSRYISKTTKKIVFSRDGGKCQCCGSYDNLEYDHIVPYSCGGRSDVSNIQLLCRSCNRSKSNDCYCKIHNKKVGIDCCAGDRSVKSSGNSYTRSIKSSGSSVQCSGTTQKGARCRKMTKSSNGRCYLH
jgi:hypothetical protein